jgi:hypothetical protein
MKKRMARKITFRIRKTRPIIPRVRISSVLMRSPGIDKF